MPASLRRLHKEIIITMYTNVNVHQEQNDTIHTITSIHIATNYIMRGWMGGSYGGPDRTG